MAITQSIRDALLDLNDHTLQAQHLAKAFDDLTFDKADQPAWVPLVLRHIERFAQSAERLEQCIHRECGQ